MSVAFKKSKRNFRQRKKDSDSEEDETVTSKVESTAVESGKDSGIGSQNANTVAGVNSVQSKQAPVDKLGLGRNVTASTLRPSSSTLSFADMDEEEEGAEVFQIKKSNRSKKVVNNFKKQLQKEKEEKKKLRPVQPAPRKITPKETVTDSPNFDTVINGEDAAKMEDEEEEKQHVFKSFLQRGEIPDANMIHAIRTQRARARETGDFIALDRTERADNSTDKSRLVRDDDNDRSDDEDTETIMLAENKAERQKQQMRDNFLAVEHGSDDEETPEWEKQQIRAGVRLTVPTEQGSNSPYSNLAASMPTPNPTPQVPGMGSGRLPGRLPEVSVEQITRNLKEGLNSMNEVHRAHKQELEKLKRDTIDSHATIRNNTEAKPRLEEQYQFFQEMRGYVRDLVECLNEKNAIIKRLDARRLRLWVERAGKFCTRRQQDVKDEAAECMPGKPVARGDMDEAWRLRTTEREARRARRSRNRGAATQHYDGMSSDDELVRSDIANASLERERILTERGNVFADVRDDFCQLPLIAERLMRWRNEHPQSYAQAYVLLCLPRLATPFLTFQMLDWSPLEEGAASIESFPWFRALALYGCDERGERMANGTNGVSTGMSDNGSNEDGVEDEEAVLLSTVVEKSLLPRITSLIRKAWDPVSSSETRRLITCVQSLLQRFPTLGPDSTCTKLLLQAVEQRLRKMVADDVYIPLYPKSALENKNSVSYKFFERRSWHAIKVYENLMQWRLILSPRLLQELAFTSLVNRYLVLALQNSEVNDRSLIKCERIIAMLPTSWLDHAKSSTLPFLEPLCRYLLHAAVHVDSWGSDPSASQDRQRQARALIVRMAKLLVKMRARDHCKTVSKTYDIDLESI